MENLKESEIFDQLVQDTDLTSILPLYQKKIVDQLLANADANPWLAAEMWLNSSTNEIAPFGGSSTAPKLYMKELEAELEKFICGDPKYKNDRKKLCDAASKGNVFIIATISTAIALQVGTVAAFITPVIVLLLKSLGKISINAWCSLRKKSESTGE
jgi:hypothetical protein